MTIPLEHRAYRWLGWLLMSPFVASAALAAETGHWGHFAVFAGFGAGIALILALQPWLPSLFSPLIAASGYLDAAGWGFRWYFEVQPYDSVAHALTTFSITLAIAYLLRTSRPVLYASHTWLFVLYVASMGLAIGAVWEVLEWLFGAAEDRTNSILDLLSNAVGALFGGFLSTKQNAGATHLVIHASNPSASSEQTGIGCE